MGVRKDLAHIPRTMHNKTVIFCVQCKLYKAREMFYRNGVSKTGRSSWCIECTLSYYRNRRLQHAHSDEE